MAFVKLPVFERGMVLTHEMLEQLKNYSQDMGNISYTDYSDGVVSGCQVLVEGMRITLKRGIVCFEGNVIPVPEGLSALVSPCNVWHALCLQISEPYNEKNFRGVDIELVVVTDVSQIGNKIELCRFRMQEGAHMRNVYRDFNDLNTEFDTLNVIYAKWAGYKSSTVSSVVLEEFAKEAIRKGVQNPLDINFIQQILNLDGRSMNRQTIEFYIAIRVGRPYKEMTGLEIFMGLAEILRNLVPTGERMPVRQRDERRIIVD